MKKTILAMIFATAMAPVFAGDDTSSTAVSVSSQQQTSLAGAAAIVPVTFTSPENTSNNVKYGGDYTIRNVPSVNGPNLTTSNDTCMGSTSGSINVAGFGIGGGSTWTDGNCKRLKNSRELWNMGFKAASMALMCGDSDNREALESTGFMCPPSKKQEDAAQSPDFMKN